MPRRIAVLVVGLVLVVAVARGQDAAGGVQVGKNLPGTFQPYNVNVSRPISEEPEELPDAKGPKRPIYTTKGKYHCLITEYDLDPVVMLVARGLDDNAAFRDLLVKLDAMLDRNTTNRLRAFVVFQYDDLANVITDDDKRDEIARRLAKFAEDAKLTRVVLSIAGKDDLAKYKLDPATALSAILYKKLTVEAVHSISKDKLDTVNGPAVKALLADVTSKLGAR